MTAFVFLPTAARTPATQNHMISNQNLSIEKVPKVGSTLVGKILEDYGWNGKDYCCQYYSNIGSSG